MSESHAGSHDAASEIEKLKLKLSELQTKNSKLYKIEENLVQDMIKISNKKMSLLACIEEMLVEKEQLKSGDCSADELLAAVQQHDTAFDLAAELVKNEHVLNISEYKERVLGIRE